ncbi:alpha-1A adrenergic receptor-like [Exaiptasia diaphana]|uniref:G-protein coupled receptors family 1 profile domain-containing protein n=1 Tax=Exaiptasia diaphana TaxID=2652724 RepID=A0A913YC20_EXADI|nr:alpha-1A adrenergic receptor-like [Exaiptasia diaphana]
MSTSSLGKPNASMNINESTSLTTCSQPTTVENIANGLFLIFIALVTVAGNSSICFAILWNNSLHRFTNYIVVSFAISDLMVGIFSLPFRIHQTLHNTAWCLGENACIFWVWVDLFCRTAAFANLALIALDRFIATKYPHTYHRKITTWSGCCCLVIVWLDALIVSTSSLTNWTLPDALVFGHNNLGCSKTPDAYFYTFSAVVGFFLPLCIIGLSYSYVLKVAVSNWKAKSKAAVNPIPPPIVDGNRTSDRIALVREIKAAQTLAIVIGSFLVCWLPVFVIVLVLYWCSTCFKGVNKPVNIIFVYILPNITSALNPIIFFIFSRKLREAFLKFCNSITKVVSRY